MARTSNAPVTKRRHNKVLKAAKGYYGGRRRLYRSARESVRRAWAFATEHRRLKKRDFRTLWNARISAGTRLNGVSYSQFMGGLKKANVRLNRKVLSEIAQDDMPTFQELIKIAGSK
jgi:large subunit ribosomal protein L20